MSHNKYYYVYIITNAYKTVLYVGVTNSLKRRMHDHSIGKKGGFSSKYKCKYLIYYEKYNDVNAAIRREKEIKKWGKLKKKALIQNRNPEIKFLNETIQLIDNEFL